MTHRIEKEKWIFYRHTNNFDIITAVAVNLKNYSNSSISPEDKKELLKKLKELKYYKERNPEMPLDAINHKINTLAYFMFGYKDKVHNQQRFLFSPLGNLFLKHIGDKEKIQKIFLTMLWGVQFPHPHSGTSKVFNLYPFRLIFKLLSDDRIGNKLYAYEVAYLVMFIKDIDLEKYEILVKELIELRKLSNEELTLRFKLNEHALVNAAYEWDYYISKFIHYANIFNLEKGEIVCRLNQGKDSIRNIRRNFVTLNKDVIQYCNKLLSEYPYYEIPLQLNSNKKLNIDIVKEIYSFYPKILLEEIKEINSDLETELLELPKLIEQYSNNNDGEEAYLFEDILEDAFNMFYNIEARKIGGAGNTDIECLYLSEQRKFAVDAKSTKNKLSSINAGRLAIHREKIGGEYTIVVTPRYVPAVKNDIKNSPIVIISARTLAEYLYNCISQGIREIDYFDFDNIILSNLGKDVSPIISQLTFDKFAILSK
ncbi:hypothetical protein [Paeniclostridium hominis]|uniref:hypothetical protein n=1 Tax=Paeniclostridium hominis TaxID=2764329 RepID=UPI0022E4A23C|nr:hypothetical protein [Paeniclostridium hominis]